MSDMFGPSGGTGGNPFTTTPPAENGPWKISAIQVWSGNRIDSIEVIWSNKHGDVRTSPKFGGSGGAEGEFIINEGDYLERIEGTVGAYENNVRLFSIQFFTKNGSNSKIYGQATQAKFRYDEVEGDQVIGLFGRSGSAVDALGVVTTAIA